MRSVLAGISAVLFFVAASAFGQEAHDSHHPEGKGAVIAPQPAPKAKPGANNKAMMDGMKTMQVQMEKLRAATDPKERERLMQEHMKTMKETMAAMHGMSGGNMGAGMAQHRVDMMQLMMEQMVEHQGAMQNQGK